MGLKERLRIKLDQLYEKRRSTDGQIKLLEGLLQEEPEEKPAKRKYQRRKPKHAELPKVKRTPLLGEVDDPPLELGTPVLAREPFTQMELFKRLREFGKNGAIFTELLQAINSVRETAKQKPVAKSVLSTMLAHMYKDKRFKKILKRVRIRGTKTSPRATYKYYYIGPPISELDIPAKAQKPKKAKPLSPGRKPFTRQEMFKVLGEFGAEGATALQLRDALNERRNEESQLTSAHISTKLSHTMKDKKWKKFLKRTHVFVEGGNRAYKYVYQY